MTFKKIIYSTGFLLAVGVLLSIVMLSPRVSRETNASTAACVDPVENTTRPWGGIVYTNWTANIADIKSVKAYVSILQDPGANTPLYLQLYDFDIDGTGQYFGIQGNGLALFSRWNTTDLSNVRTGPGASAVAGTSEGSFVSLRYYNLFGTSLPVGNYVVEVRRAEYDGVGDWFNLYVTKENMAEQYIGGLRFPRRNAATPASFTDGGGSWIEDWRQESSVFSIPSWDVKVMTVFNSQWTPQSASSTYSPDMSNSDASFDGAYVRLKVGGHTPRCNPAGTLFSTRPLYPVFPTPTPIPPDTIPPTIRITTPSAGSQLPSKGTVKVSASAQDGSGIAKIRILIDSQLVTSCDLTTTCSYSWSVSKVSRGQHTISAVAIDRSANSNTSTTSLVVTK